MVGSSSALACLVVPAFIISRVQPRNQYAQNFVWARLSISPACRLFYEPEPREVHLAEREALSYLALGWETKYIAEEMGVNWYTARNHIENLRGKLGASTRLEAMRLGIIPSE